MSLNVIPLLQAFSSVILRVCGTSRGPSASAELRVSHTIELVSDSAGYERTDCSVAGASNCVGLEVGDDSVGSLPHEHLTSCPLISVPCTATIACVADSFVLNLQPHERRLYIQSLGKETFQYNTLNSQRERGRAHVTHFERTILDFEKLCHGWSTVLNCVQQ